MHLDFVGYKYYNGNHWALAAGRGGGGGGGVLLDFVDVYTYYN